MELTCLGSFSTDLSFTSADQGVVQNLDVWLATKRKTMNRVELYLCKVKETLFLRRIPLFNRASQKLFGQAL